VNFEKRPKTVDWSGSKEYPEGGRAASEQSIKILYRFNTMELLP
jgi:hypothetical protein